MKNFTITNTTSGLTLGTYTASTREEALDKMAQDAGYDSQAAALEVTGGDGSDLLVEEERVVEYAIRLQPGANQGSFWATTQAHEVDGRVVSSIDRYGEDGLAFVVLEVPIGNTSYLEEQLDADEKVVGYAERGE